jgi:Amt family ammonium transporter
MTVNGALAGLVGITAPCAFVTPVASVAIGFIAGILVVFGVLAFDKLKLDDPVGALSVHLVCGIWGTIAVGLFATMAAPGGIDKNGLLYGGGIELLLIQLTGVTVVGVFAFSVSMAAWWALKATLGIRVDPIVEIEGLDVHEMGSEAYPAERSMDIERLLATVAGAEPVAVKRTPRKASFPGGAPPYTLTLHNVDMEAFMARWRNLCGSDEPASEDFRMVYKYFTTIRGSELRFRGGNPHDVREKLQAVASTIDPTAFAEVKVGWSKKPAEALAV